MKKGKVRSYAQESLHIGDKDTELEDFEDENESMLQESMWASEYEQL